MAVTFKPNPDGSTSIFSGSTEVLRIPATAPQQIDLGNRGITTGNSYTCNGTETFKDFTIPSWAKNITVMVVGLSTSGTSNLQLQLGISSGIDNTGYTSEASQGTGSVFVTTGFAITQTIAATSIMQGIISIANVTGNTFVASGNIGFNATYTLAVSTGSKTLTGALTTLRITTVNGTDLFDANSIINVSWEG